MQETAQKIQNIQLNLGCGNQTLESWINVDISEVSSSEFNR